MLLGSDGSLVQINLPVHQAACHKEFLHRVDTLHLYHQFVIAYVQHLKQAFAGHTSFLYAGEETVTAEIVHAVHVQLAGNELVEEMFRVLVLEDRDRGIERLLALGFWLLAFG